MASRSDDILHSSRARPCLVRGARVVGALAGAPVLDVLFRAGRVEAVAPALTAAADVEIVEASGAWLLPGWIDLQVNDIEWLAAGPKRPGEHAQRARQVARHQAARGVTGFILATVAAPFDHLLGYLRGLQCALEAPQAVGDEALLGALVEGTFMNPQFCGAHNPQWILTPTRDLIDRLLETRAVRLLNLAPETTVEAIELIAHATAQGVVVGVGHAKPHAERLREAVQAGLRYVIHLGNGPTGSSLKAFHQGGMLEESLRNDDLIASIILDGWHVHPDLVRDWIARKEPRRVCLVSDAAFAMGLPAGEFAAFGVRGQVGPGGGYLMVVRPPAQDPVRHLTSDVAPLFGSAVGMRAVFENAVNLLTVPRAGVYQRWHEALTLEQALAESSQMCAAVPARLLGLADRGGLEPGQRSDAVLVELEGGPGAWVVSVRRVWVG